MFTQFSSTAETLSKASTMVFRIGTDAHLYDDPEDVRIAPLLDSKYDSEKCEALKRLLALIAQGFEVSNFFPQVVKNVATQSVEVKKLVYLYLLHYAEKRPSEALLSINYFQKDLGDTNPLVRAWSLRAMAGIRLHVIAPIVLVAIGKCARDPSVYVRKCAANAIPKLYELRLKEHTSALEEIVGMLLNDNSPGVVGAAAAVFASICPNNLLLIGRSYRRLCESLPDVEEWGQIALIWILLRYITARHGLVKESIMFCLHNNEGSHSDKDDIDRQLKAEEGSDDITSRIYESEMANMVSRCYIEGPDEFLSRSSGNKVSSLLDHECFTSGKSNDDVRVLLQCTSPLLWSQNSAVVLAAVSVHWIMSPINHLERIVKPLLFLLRSSRASKYVVLCNIQVFAKAIPALFESHFEEFFISSLDSYQIKSIKLEILASIATDSSISLIFQEFEDYIRDPDRRFAADTVAAIGRSAQRLRKTANTCLEGLLALTREETFIGDSGPVDEEADVLIQAVMSIKAIIMRDPSTHEKVIIQLIRSLDSIKIPASRAVIVWLIGEYSTLGKIIPKMLTTVLQYLAQSFTLESWETKLQILNTSVKILDARECLCEKDLRTAKILLVYVLELAECDLNYDVRGRAQFLKQLLSNNLCLQEDTNCLAEKQELALKLVQCMFRGQTLPTSSEPINYRFYLPGSLSHIVLHAAPGYEPLPKPRDYNIHTVLQDGTYDSDSSGTGGDDNTSSKSFNEEGTSGYSSQQSVSGSIVSEGEESAEESCSNTNDGSLINISDTRTKHNEDSQLGSNGLENLISKRDLESWLDEKVDLSKSHSSKGSQVRKSSAKISIGDLSSRVKPKRNILLDPSNGNGLRVSYSFSSDNSSIFSQLVCLDVLFENCAKESMTNVFLVDEDSDKKQDSGNQLLASVASSTSHNDVPTLVSVEEIDSLEPGETVKRSVHVRFNHHLLPLKLALRCNGKKHPVKLWPDIGYFVKPLPVDIKAFTNKEQQLPGMFEYSRRCIFSDHVAELNSDMSHSAPVKDKFRVICETLALKMLSNANIFLVSVDMPVASNLDDASGLCLRFSCEILSNSVPCLITIVVEGKFSEPLNVFVKVNCEETVFGLNLLNRVINFLVETPFTQ